MTGLCYRSNNMPTIYRKSGLHPDSDLRPRHHLENDHFKVWSGNPGEVVSHNGILFQWKEAEIMHNPNTWDNKVPEPHIAITKLVSLDDGNTWVEDEVTSPYSWSRNSKNSLWQKIEDAITKSKEEFQKNRNRELARERTAKLKAEATASGMSVAEYKAKKLANATPKVSKQTVEQLKRKVAVGSILKELQDEIGMVMKKLDSDEIKIVHVDRYASRLKVAVRILKEWQK